MNKLAESLKDKKAFVTIICAIICIGILFYAYTTRVNNVVKSVNVPYAKEEISPRTLITEEMVGTVKVASSMLTENVIRTNNDVIGKYSNYNSTIPEGSLFYNTAVVDWASMPDSAWSNIAEGNTVLSLSISGNVMVKSAIYPGAVIDLYYKTNDQNRLVYGKLIENIKVLAVKDSSGNHIFERTSGNTTVSAIIFSLSEDYFLLLKDASFLGGDLVPVLRNSAYRDKEAEYEVSSLYLADLIKSQVDSKYSIPDVIDTASDVEEVIIDGDQVIKPNENPVNNNATNNVNQNTNTNTTNNGNNKK